MRHAIVFLKAAAFFLCTMTAILVGFSSTVGATDLLNGGYVSGTIDYEGDIDTYTFSLNAGETVMIRMADISVTGDLAPMLNLYSPSGTHLTGVTNGDSLVASIHYTATETGIYKIEASDRNYASTGSYNIYFAHMPGANEYGELLNDGLHQGEIDLGDLDTYTFTVNAGETVMIRMTDTSESGDLVPLLNLYSPSGAILSGVCDWDALVASIHYTATETGTYTLLACDRSYGHGNSKTGSYNIYFAHMPGANEYGELLNDGLHQGEIDLGDLDTYTFTVNAGETVMIRMTDTSESGDLVPLLNLYSPSGAILSGVCDWDALVASIHYTATETGTYTLLACDRSYGHGNSKTGSYNIYFAHMPGANEYGELLNDGLHQGEIDLGDLDTYTFTVNAGETVMIRMTDTSESGDLVPLLNLYSPSGAILSGVCDWDALVASIHYTATETGTYTLLACDRSYGHGNSKTGSYNIYFAHMPGANEYGELINDGLHQGEIALGDLDTYTFTVNAGETVMIRMTDTSESGDLVPLLNLYSPSGACLSGVCDWDALVASIHYTAAETGTYTLLACDRSYGSGSSKTGSYNIYFAHIPGANEHGVIENSELPSETIDQGDIDSYTFTATTGDTMEIQVSDTSVGGTLTPCIALYGPDGNLASSNCGNNAAYIKYTASEDGTYTLVITDSSGTGYGEYMLSYYNDAYPIDFCKYDFDNDDDIDGEDLVYFQSEYETVYIYDIKGLENFGESLGKMDCEETE